MSLGMKVLGRDAGRVFHALGRGDHYLAVARTFRVHQNPVDALSRYLVNRGRYPWTPTVRTPLGPVHPTIYSQQDVFTLNEIFCRYDYGSGGPRIVVDLGANIGLASLFFLTRRADSVVYASEPVQRNLDRLRINLDPFVGRFHVDERAVSTRSGQADFLVEETGRLGGLSEFSDGREGDTITVDCVPIAELIGGILEREGRVDLVKIDTEGNEKVLVDAIPSGMRSSIGAIVWENNDGTVRWWRGGRQTA